MNVRIIILEAGHLSSVAVSGGDKLINSMMPHFKKLRSANFTIIIPSIAKRHWPTKTKANFYLLKEIFLEKHINSPIAVFFVYIWRSLQMLRYLLSVKKPAILYSSSAEIVDWLAPFIIKLFSRDVIWIVRIHHLKELPQNRSGVLFTNYFSFLIEKVGLLCFQKADLVIVLNKSLESKISKYVSRTKIKTLGAGIDLKKIKNFKAIVNTPFYDSVFLGRIHYTKGVLDLPMIWKNVQKKLPNARLAIIGELSIPQLEKQLRAKIRNLNLQDAIDILGFQKKTVVLSILKRSKVFLFCDHEAGFSIASSEAMASGLPVVGWDIGVLGDVYKKGYIKIPPFKFGEFASALVKILSDQKLQKKLSREATHEAQKHDWQKVAGAFENILLNLSQNKYGV